MIERDLDPSNEEIIDRLRRMKVFNAFNDEQLAHALAISKIRRYSVGETLIRQGDYDQWFYFLVSGELTILVDGVEVNRIRRLGDVFGEMGIIDGSPRSATIQAEQPTLCVAVDGAFLDQQNSENQLMAQAIFYRIFSEMLAVRLRDTSQRVTDLERRLADENFLFDDLE